MGDMNSPHPSAPDHKDSVASPSNSDPKNSSSDCGDNISSSHHRWDFDGLDPLTFEKHAGKSIPLYQEGHDLICDLSAFFTPESGSVLDIGCSTGRLLKSLVARHAHRKDLKFLGIDQSQTMVEWAESQSNDPRLKWSCEDINTAAVEKHDLIISYYTVQFVPPRLRQELINRLYESLNWGGALILFEKVRGPDARFQDILTQLYTDYKIKQGYGAEEIINKTQSLKGILEPFSSQGNLDLMKRAGFVDITTVQRYLCFEGFLAIK